MLSHVFESHCCRKKLTRHTDFLKTCESPYSKVTGLTTRWLRGHIYNILCANRNIYINKTRSIPLQEVVGKYSNFKRSTWEQSVYGVVDLFFMVAPNYKIPMQFFIFYNFHMTCFVSDTRAITYCKLKAHSQISFTHDLAIQ